MVVNKPLVSVHEMTKRGDKIVMDNEYSYVLNEATKINTELVVKNGVYTIPMGLESNTVEHPRKEDIEMDPMKDRPLKEMQAMPAPYFRRQAGWP